MLAHIGNEGDTVSDSAWITRPPGDHNIQAFIIDRRRDTNIDISYRARLADGTWTDWVGLNQLVGRRGKREDLTGFSVRLGDTFQKDFDIEVIGAFNGEPNNVVVRGGEDCIPRSGLGSLCGMQLILRAKSAPVSAQ
jgi:hypothetical protein